MSEPYIGEIRMVGFNFAPVGWALCNGQLMPISENETLFNLIGTTFGGDGQETFALPNLQSRIPIHQGQGLGLSDRTLGETGGTETVTLTQNQIPSHTHVPGANSAVGTATDPAGNFWAQRSGTNQYSNVAPSGATMAAGALQAIGGSQPHDNLPPYLTINFIMSMFGIFPTP